MTRNISTNEREDIHQQPDLATGKFDVGQVWKYANRNGEDGSTLTILKIEKHDKGDTIVHIRVDDVKIYRAQAQTGYCTFIEHLPFSEKAVANSVTNVVEQNNNLPDFSDGYSEWKEAWVRGQAGYWRVDIKEAIDCIDKAMQ